MPKIKQEELNEIIDFVIENYEYDEVSRSYLEWLIKTHEIYGTLMVIRDQDNSLIAISRWNILPTGTDAHIMDIIIREDWRNKGLMKSMLLKGLIKFPEVKYLIFERHTEGKPFKKVPLKWLLKRRF